MNIDWSAKKQESEARAGQKSTELTGKETPDQELAKWQLRELRTISSRLNALVIIVIVEGLAILVIAWRVLGELTIKVAR